MRDKNAVITGVAFFCGVVTALILPPFWAVLAGLAAVGLALWLASDSCRCRRRR